MRAFRRQSAVRISGTMPRRFPLPTTLIPPGLGLQRRIMLYVGTSLVLLFGGYFIIGVGTVNRSTDMVFGERLTIAQSVAASVGQEFDHSIRDSIDELKILTTSSDQATAFSVVGEIYVHLSEIDAFTFFNVRHVILLREGGEIISAAPPFLRDTDARTFPALRSETLPTDPNLRFFWNETPDGEGVLCISRPVRDANGGVWAHLIIEMSPVDFHGSFSPFGNLERSAGDHQESQIYTKQAEYYLEIMTTEGLTVGGVGPSAHAGEKSSHYSLVASTVGARAAGVVLHNMDRVSELQDHVVAIVPVPETNLYLLLEQDIDVALALPNKFMSDIILYGVLGFIVAMIAAWITTRRVVLPTERLTQAAVRMAHGELTIPIKVGAQDEIGVLASNLELMRRQLNDALERVGTANRDLESRVAERTRRLQELVRQVLTAQEEERNRVALELHDETAQIISAITFTLDSIVRKENGLGVEDSKRLREVRDLSGELLEGTRRLISALRPVALIDIGLGSALRSHAEVLFGSTEVEIHVTDHSGGMHLPDYVELVFYRVGQEALTNVAKHSDCRDVWVEVSRNDGKLNLVVRDNGVGFDVESVLSGEGRGVGLTGMRERAALINGEVNVHSKPNVGTTVEIKASIEDDD